MAVAAEAAETTTPAESCFSTPRGCEYRWRRGILPSAASGHRKDTGGGNATNPCVPPQSPISAESQAEDSGFVPPFTMPTVLFLRLYKPRKIVVPRVPPMKIEEAKPDPTEFSMLRNEMSALRSPLLQAFVDSATFYAEGQHSRHNIPRFLSDHLFS